MAGWSWDEDLDELAKETLRPEATRSAALGRRNMRREGGLLMQG